MKKVLGLDLGVASIGWAIISENENQKNILGMGSRIIPLSTDDKDEFSTGNAISKNQKRTQKRTQRKGYDRYQQRRKALTTELIKHKMFDPELLHLPSLALWGLRHRAVTEQVSLTELGRLLYHLNQKRGYKSSRKDSNLDKKDTDYVAEVKSRFSKITEESLTIGQYIYKGLTSSHDSDDWLSICQKFNLNPLLPFRAKQQVFPREAYIEEFDKIIKNQKKYYPDILDNVLINKIRNQIIYFQRKLKSQKGLVSICEFEGFYVKNKEGKVIYTGPRVAPRSSPLFQVCKIWENINSISIINKKGEKLELSTDQKRLIFDHLNTNDRLNINDIRKLLNLKKEDGWLGNKQLEKGIQGNLTRSAIAKCFDNPEQYNNLLKFELICDKKNSELVDTETGEIIKNLRTISSAFEKEPFYRIWHLIYSIPDDDDPTLVKILENKYQIPHETAQKLAKIDFRKQGFGNKSAKAIRKILPYLMEGYVFSEACNLAGYNHSESITKEQNLNRSLKDKLDLLPKNSLRQPIVEKILNQMINLVNAVIDKYGHPDEIRVELARELKQSKEERNEAFKNISKRERENKIISERLEKDYGVRASRRNILKMRLYEEISDKEGKINATCVYCGKTFGLAQALNGDEVDIEHIIPQSLLFDDSQANKTLSHRQCNADKGNSTAYDYMKSKSADEFDHYIDRVERLLKDGIINRAKHNKLLTAGDKIPKDFIDRQIRETQYISRKSHEILSLICRNVYATSGSVTEYLRRSWGWDEVTMNLHIERYKELNLNNLIEIEEFQDNTGVKKYKEKLKGWTKRDDHRHHAIDALTIACTGQGIIQRLNNLRASSLNDKNSMINEEILDIKKSRLENFIISQKPFTTHQVEQFTKNILISFKPGKKVATYSRRIYKGRIVQSNIITPRGPLCEESVYGKIKLLKKGVSLKQLFDNPNTIVKKKIRDKIIERLANSGNDPAKAFKSCKENPIYLDSQNLIELTYASVYEDEYVLKYPVSGLKDKDIDSVVDQELRLALLKRLEQFGNNEKEAFKDLVNNAVWYNEEKKIPVKTVRLKTGLKAVVPVSYDKQGHEIGYVKPGNNHHLAIYKDETGMYHEHLVTFWHAVERKQNNIPVVITSPSETWQKITESTTELNESFLCSLPDPKWTYIVSMQQNELFLLSEDKEVLTEAITINDLSAISKYLFRVQKISNNEYNFRHHLETQLENSDIVKQSLRLYRIRSLQSFFSLNPIKISINNLGDIVQTNNIIRDF